MRTTIDMTTYARRGHFELYRHMGYPYVGATVEVDVTALYAQAKERGESFFLHTLYAAGRAANDVPQLRQRILGEGIVEYDNCPTSHIELKPDDTYAYCEAETNLPWAAFYAQTSARQEIARTIGTIEEDGDPLSKIYVSCTPWIHYTALIQPVPFPADSIPRITWGKFERRDGRLMMPMTLLAHHALADGLHIGRFYQALEARMREEK